MDELCVNPNITTSPNASPPLVDDSEACQILWRLTELNFQFELLALDKRAGVTNQDEMEQQETIKDCLRIWSLVVADTQEASSGLCSDKWHVRLPCLLRLQDLMKDWEGMRPPSLQECPQAIDKYSESDARLLEDGVACFYTDTFFSFFGRAAVIPALCPLN